ncbi:MAG: 16S rRNA (adenine(1518)-N(6)/adenine(1519)-N(6))-dimethyltransferase RsmA [Candidatus Bathyarchaeota archaeon]|nr:16S rRNA (adenine(1518)-N(6)/adenine(1519)-N(6))-dimethyltransferase RsmA [Candidatus Bathyarchaeota archaeon]
MDLLPRARRLLHLHRVFPKKRLGQNFVTNRALLQKMISYASVSREDTVLEVGAGLGFLTQLLSPACRRVIAVEIDPRLTKILRSELRGLGNVDIVEGDVLSLSVPQFSKVVSTPPYSISSPLLFWLLERRFDCAVLTFQKEFAERLNAPVGSRDYGRLTVGTYYRAEAELLDHVPRSMFYPPPDVDSMVVRLKPREKPPFPVEDEEAFFKLVQTLFTQRNKKVRNAIVPFLRGRMKKADVTRLADSLLFHDKRARELAPEDFGAMSDEIVRRSRGKD